MNAMSQWNSSHQNTVLIIKDDCASRNHLTAMLKGMGFRTICTENCFFLNFVFLFFHHVKAVVIDLNRNRKVCSKITKHLHKLHQRLNFNDNIPIIFVTTNDKMTPAFNNYYYLYDPVNEDSLADILEKIGLHPIKHNNSSLHPVSSQ